MTITEQLDELAAGVLRAKHQGANLAHRAALGVDPLELWGRASELAQELEQLTAQAQELEHHYRAAVAEPLAQDLGLGILQVLEGGVP